MGVPFWVFGLWSLVFGLWSWVFGCGLDCQSRVMKSVPPRGSGWVRSPITVVNRRSPI